MAKDAKTRARARALYEAGHSLNDIAAELDLDRKSVLAWSKKEGWIKGRKGPELDRKAELALEAEAERHGVTKGKVFAKVAQLMEAKKTEFYQGQAVATVTDNGTQTSATSLAADLLGMKKEIVTVNPSDEMRKLWALAKGGA